MATSYEEIGKIGTSALMTVSARGTGLYLYVPKRIEEIFGITAGDRIEVKLERHYRPKKEGE